MPDNERYVGDVFIDGKTDRLLQEFLTNLFNQYNGEGKGFNADMLDGHHYSEIEKELTRLDSEKLSQIVIGNSVFNSESSGNYLHFSDVTYNDYELLPWMNNLPEDYDITDALKDIYATLTEIIATTADTKVDKAKVDENDMSDFPRMKVLSDNNFDDTYKAELDDLKSVLDTLVDYQDENGTTRHLFNSQMTNGLRFILITQDLYDEYKNSSDANKRNFINSWRNVFIIKEPSQMPDAIEYDNPLNYSLTDGYHFRLANDPEDNSVINQIDPQSSDPVWLQIKHNWSSTWQNLVTLDGLLKNANLDDIVLNVLEEYPNAVYNPVALKNSIIDILTDPTNSNYIQLPYLSSSYKNNYVHEITKNNTALASTGSDYGLSVDITHAFDTELNNITSKVNNISNSNQTGTLDVQIKNLSSSLSSLDSKVNGTASNSIVKQLSSIGTSIGQIQSDLDDIRSEISSLNNNLTTWNRIDMPTLKDFNGNTTYVLYNEYLKMAVVKLAFAHHHLKETAGTWVIPNRKFDVVYSDAILKPMPIGNPSMLSIGDGHGIEVGLLSNGQIMVNCALTQHRKFNINGQLFYKYSALSE